MESNMRDTGDQPVQTLMTETGPASFVSAQTPTVGIPDLQELKSVFFQAQQDLLGQAIRRANQAGHQSIGWAETINPANQTILEQKGYTVMDDELPDGSARSTISWEL